MDDRLARLEALNKTLVPPDFLGGVFLPPDSPKKFFDVMFLAEMPSMNVPAGWVEGQPNFNFNVTSRDRFLQEMMSKYGVAGRYVTDIVKSRAAPGIPTAAKIAEWLPTLRQEIEIIQPQSLVVIGKRTHDQSFMPFVAQHIRKNIKIDWVFHYSNQVTRKRFEDRFREVVGPLKANESQLVCGLGSKRPN